jgi:hypothetical protein
VEKKKKIEINLQDFEQQLIMSGIMGLMDKHPDRHEVLDLVKRISETVFMAHLNEKRGIH